MTFIFDLDDTLLDTRALKVVLFELMQKSGASIEEIEVSYNLFTGKDLYNPESHIKYIAKNNINVNLETFIEKYNSIKYKDFLLPGVEEILKEAKDYGTNILFTKGDRSFQARKIVSANINDFFDDIIITHDEKADVVSNLNFDGQVFVFNDKSLENKAMSEVAPEWQYVDTRNLVNDWQEIKKRIDGINP